ncbi:MAG: alcohol dehydrogenase catalytic domain-containing protein [Acidobacteriota bacterium]
MKPAEKPLGDSDEPPATCVCGSDLWPYRGTDAPTEPTPMGHEYCGIVEEVGSEVRNIQRGQFVVGSFFASDNTCEICHAGYQSRCVQAPLLRVPGGGEEPMNGALAPDALRCRRDSRRS